MIELLITTLAVYGASKLLAEYDGFMDVFYRIRSIKWLRMLTCVVCTSVWLSLAFSAVLWLGFAAWLLPLAIVGVIILIEEKL